MQKLFSIGIAILFLIACNTKSETRKVISDKMSMQLLAFDDKESVSEKGDFISATIQLNDGKTMLYNRFYHQIFKAENELLEQVFSNLREGDSAVFYIHPSLVEHNIEGIKLPEITNKELIMYVKVLHYFNEEEKNNFLKQLDNDLIEYQYLNFYMKTLQTDKPILKKGIYKVIIEEGTGKAMKKDDLIRIKYKGYFLNNVLFDETPENGFLEFEFGTPNQVIRGIEIAIKDMKVGEKSKIIIPSHLAFGAGGSSTGRIPPATPVMYELEIVKIN
ncbi:MAG: hypothetical protein COW67_11620 [Flavobacteriales bacterium CG18_big_fil_WC_8_21_14_2_50_32_9]|nr:MAG: hypothetical protein COW67_11620 [Flavobacteriales bacterium CG18_big_fil_WC_8_21_14_2_50_32_9]